MSPSHLSPSDQPLTRSRTNLFLSYRDSSATRARPSHHSIYVDDGDGLGGESSGLLQGADGDGGGAGNGGAALPPRWVDIAEQVDQIIAKVKPKMTQLDRLHAKHILPGFKDRSAEEREIDALASEITKDFRACQRLIRRIADLSQALLRASASGGTGKSSEATRLDLIMVANVQTALATKVQDLSGVFRKKQTAYLKQLKGHESRSNFGSTPSSPDPLGSVASDEQYSQSLLQQQQQSLSAHPHLNLDQRTNEISAIAQSITDLADLFKDLSSLVIDQGTLLDRVDYNVEQMGVDVKGAVEELKEATTYQRRSGKCQLIFLLLLLIAGVCILIAYKPRRRNDSPLITVPDPQPHPDSDGAAVPEPDGGVMRLVWERSLPLAVPIGDEGTRERRGWRDGVDATRFADKEKPRASVELPARRRGRRDEGRGKRWSREEGRL